MRHTLTIIAVLAASMSLNAQKAYQVTSPDGRLQITVNDGPSLNWQINHDGTTVLTPSDIALVVDRGNGKTATLGQNAKVKKAVRTSVDQTIQTPVYKKSAVHDNYNQLTLKCKDGYDLEVRAYDDAAAYRFVLNGKAPVSVITENVNYNFDKDYKTFVPYVNDNRGGERYCYSFESYYDEAPMSQMFVDSLAITPLMVCLDGGKKAVLMDAGVWDYPGMYLKLNTSALHGLTSEFAPLPAETEVGGFNRLNLMPSQRADKLAQLSGQSQLPWRAVVVVDNDAELAANDISQRLAPACKIADTSWIKPGKVAWDWWNTCTLRGVDFVTGMNTPTYKGFIDFAAANGLEYIIIDEGWSTVESMTENLNPDIDLVELVRYGNEKNVGIILWACWRNIIKDAPNTMKHYADMGIKGFKIDFVDRDDQVAVSSLQTLAQLAADNHLLVDYHGMKPNGLQRAYPNIVNYEGVKGLENAKWEPVGANGPVHDFPRYDVTAPYLRMLAGPMDYTPGAMTNKTRGEFRAINDHPMSMGTRVHQLAMYTLFDAPLQMLADSPSNYTDEQECTDFIALVPTTFDNTIALDGEVGEYLTMARSKDGVWWVASMTNWDKRDVCIDLSFLGDGTYEAEIFADGVNADKDATDYRRTCRTVTSADKLEATLMPGGGWTARLHKVGTAK